MSLAVPLPFLQGFVSPVIPVTGATTLTAAQSGSLVTLTTNVTAAYTVTLPQASPGVWFKFSVLAVANATNINISVANGAGSGGLFGFLVGLNTMVPLANRSILTIVQTNARQGDTIDVVCDSTGNWNVRGFAQVAAAFTTTP